MTHVTRFTGPGGQLEAAISAEQISEEEARKISERFRQTWPVLEGPMTGLRAGELLVLNGVMHHRPRRAMSSSRFMLHLIAGEQRLVRSLSFMGEPALLSTRLELPVPRQPHPRQDIRAWAGFFYAGLGATRSSR